MMVAHNNEGPKKLARDVLPLNYLSTVNGSMDLQRQLCAATQQGCIATFNKLVKAGANAKECIKHGYTLLHIAAANGHIEMCLLLIHEHGVNVHIKDDEFGTTPLYMSAKNGHARVCALLMRYQPDVNTTDLFGSTALHLAAEHGHIDVCRVLIQCGAAVNAIDVLNFTPLDRSEQAGHMAVYDVLIKSGGVRGGLHLRFPFPCPG